MAKPKRKTREQQEWEDAQPEPPSKSQLKREMEALQVLGKQIIEMKPALRAQLPLSDDMLAAVKEMERITSHEARRRHMQYVGKVMRNEDVDGIHAAFKRIEDQQNSRDVAFHQLEQWRDRLIDEGDDALDDLLVKLPNIDISQVRQLIRNARRERDTGKAPSNSRKLFKLLREQQNL